MNFEYGTVSIKGKSHIDSNLPNQDYVDAYHIEDTVVLIAADGAGSSRLSAEGARRVVSKVLNNLKDIKDKKFIQDPHKYEVILKKIIIDSIDELRKNLTEGKKEEFDIIKKKEINLAELFTNPYTKIVNFFSKSKPSQKTIEVPIQTVEIVEEDQSIKEQNENIDNSSDKIVETKLSDYASTFLLVINSPLSTFMAHIGDGYIVGYNRKSDNLDTKDQFISLPRNGEYENQTYFFTDDNWEKNIRIDSRKQFYNFCLVLTDGADGFWIGPNRKSLHEPLLDNFIKIRQKNKSENLSSILEKVFTYEKISSVSSDDATIGMILR